MKRALVLICAVALVPARLQADDPAVAFRGEVSKPRAFTVVDLQKLKPIEVEGNDHGVKARFRGVALSTLLAEAGAPLGKALRGEKLTLCVLVTAKDGYRAVFALPELDPDFTDRVIILAFERDGKPLAAAAGPFQVVVPDEKRASRWVRQVTSVEVLQSSP